MTMLPTFTVEATVQARAPGVVGTVSRTTQGGEDWVADGWAGFLKSGTRLIAGHWHWHWQDDLWAFTPKEPADIHVLRARSEWEVLDGYWGERAVVVFDETRQWQRMRFQPSDAVQMRRPNVTWLKRPAEHEARGGPLIKEGWDHEHCAICWGKIGRGGEAEGHVSDDGTWVCRRCYHDFVDGRSLCFIPED